MFLYPGYKLPAPVPAVHVLDEHGLILSSNINPLNSITGEDIVGTYATDHLEASQSLKYLTAIEDCIYKGYAHFNFTILDTNWFCVMNRISNMRIKVKEWNIDGMALSEVLNLI